MTYSEEMKTSSTYIYFLQKSLIGVLCTTNYHI